MSCKACARSLRGLGEGPMPNCGGCGARSIARSSAMLTAMDPSRTQDDRKAAGDDLIEQLKALASKHRITYQQARAEAIDWYRIDQLNRGEVPQESTT